MKTMRTLSRMMAAAATAMMVLTATALKLEMIGFGIAIYVVAGMAILLIISGASNYILTAAIEEHMNRKLIYQMQEDEKGRTLSDFDFELIDLRRAFN